MFFFVMLGTFFFSFFESFLVFFPLFNKWKLVFVFDFISKLFFIVLLLIVYSVTAFSRDYMVSDKNYKRFLFLVNLFVLAMIFLMFTPHFIWFLVGWDGLGFTSLGLVAYYNSPSSWSASLKTFLINRLGDSFMIMSVGLLIFQHEYFFFGYDSLLLFFTSILVIIGLTTKSAQFPFSAWLPAAMAAPTPVSALVHSSTLVTAGIYILIRFSQKKLIEGGYLGSVGLLTLMVGAISAFLEQDAKKIVAFSTLSNLGLMVVAISFSSFYLSFFHLITHALSKALLFMCVGYFMLKKNHFQDCRLLKSKKNKLFLSVISIYSVFSLSGFFFTSGFLSKDLILETYFLSKNSIFYFFLVLSVFFTGSYSARLIIQLLTMSSFSSCSKILPKKTKSFFSIFFLFLGGVLVGYLIFYFLKISLMVCGVWYNMMIYLLVVLGWLLYLNIGNFFWSWVFSKILFLENFNSSFWISFFSKFGIFLKVNLDQGLFNYAKKQVKVLDEIFWSYLVINYNIYTTPVMSYLGSIILMSLLLIKIL